MKQKPLSWYKKQLWAYFAPYIKKRGNGRCFTCGRRCEGKNAHCGHFIKASVCGIELYFNEDNNQLQCAYCNLFLDGNQYEYGIKLGEEKVKELKVVQKKTKGKQWDRKTYQQKIDYYKNI